MVPNEKKKTKQSLELVDPALPQIVRDSRVATNLTVSSFEKPKIQRRKI